LTSLVLHLFVSVLMVGPSPLIKVCFQSATSHCP